MTVSSVLATFAMAESPAPAATPSSGGNAIVYLAVNHQPVRAGQNLPVLIVNRAPQPVLRSICFELQLREGGHWQTITKTHGQTVPCPLNTGGIPINARSTSLASINLYDDLRPGVYRVVLAYKLLPVHWQVASLRHHKLLTTELTILAFRPGPAPHLSESRIRRIALKEGAGGHITLIQHAEGTRFEANLLAGGDLVFDWQWGYLIAIKGHFTFTPPSPPTRGTQHPHTYSVITVIVDAKTGQPEDFGISDQYPNLAKLGPVTTDDHG